MVMSSCGGDSGSAYQGIRRPSPLDVSSVSITDARDGSAVAVTPPEGDITLVYFGYTHCPDVCPTTFADLRLAMEDLGPLADRVSTVFVTADPQRDTADVLDNYVGSFLDRYSVVRIEDPARLREVEAQFQASSELGPVDDDGNYDVSHTAIVYAVDPSGTVQVEWPFGTKAPAIVNDLELLLS